MQKAVSPLFQISLCAVGYLIANSNISLAQVTPDATINTQVDQNGSVAEITGGETRGGNLFHSFQDFSVPTGNEAFFDNANNISNILSRVTGGNVSNIDGLIRANGSASLFLINPAGIVFGQNASLNIGGSFYGSSASSILFEGGEFSAADLENPPLLTVNAPICLGFRDNPGDIVNRASTGNALEVLEGQNISLIGGNVNIEEGGIVFAPGGKVELGGLLKAGIINITEDSSLSFPDGVTRGDVSLTDSSNIAVFSNIGGSIKVNAKNFDLTSGSFFNVGIGTDGNSLESQAGDVIINATDNVSLNSASIFNQISPDAMGNSGNIDIRGENISIANGGSILNDISGQGNAGNITLAAADNIIIDGGNSLTGILSFVGATGEGNLGSIQSTAKNISFTNGGIITSLVAGAGSSENIDITTNNLVIDGENPSNDLNPSGITITNAGIGNSGDINVSTDNLAVTNGGQISGSVSDGLGDAGNVNITAKEILIQGEATRPGLVSIISSDVQGESEGNGGNINITTDSLVLEEGGQVSSSTLSEGNAGTININAANNISINGGNGNITSRISAVALNNLIGRGGSIIINTSNISVTNEGDISTVSTGQENAGTISVTTDNFFIDNGTLNTTNSGQGDAGTISITVSDQFTATNGSLILANVGNTIEAPTVGRVGNIEIIAQEISFDNNAQIQAGAFSGATAEGSGSVSLTASESISFTGLNTGIFSNNDPGSFGNASDAILSAPLINFKDGAIVTSVNLGEGNGGNVIIEADNLSLENGNTISAATVSGTGGNVTLDIAENITLQDNNSLESNNLISARATEDANGGNININAQFIVAFPNQNNDIVADAEQGNGGNITINAESLFGISEGVAVEGNGTNDIDASSQFNLDGNVTIDTPDINPIQGTTELPSNIVVPEQTTAQACQANREVAAKNGLTVKGKGGVPPAPDLAMDSQNIYINGEDANSLSGIPPAIATSNGKIKLARGIKVTEDGGIVLTAYRTNNSGERLPAIKRNCDR